MHTSQQSKQKLAHITYVLDNQAAAIVKPIPDIQVTTTVTSIGDEKVVVDVNTLKKQET